MNGDETHKRGLVCVRVGGGVAVRYDEESLEISTDALYALEAIAIERERLTIRLAELDGAEDAIRKRYREVFV